MASEVPEMFDGFGPQLNMFMSVGILLQYFRFTSVFFASLQELHITLHVED